ncbi:MAG TPA: 3-phosphoshikimate 1-carboxyvinyltransferase, partial [Solirubrobacteraceae bacterium]|nr:3-phosphoshikimate 1-carboxyvinyltransferase [Solirubrobacteraceae bacterium]
SKSITNRALVCAALAEGRSVLRGALFAEDTFAMGDAVAAFGGSVIASQAGSATMVVSGVGRPRGGSRIDARQSGTTSRFVLPVAGLAADRVVVDGDPQLRARPFGPLFDALRELGAEVSELGEAGRLPVAVRGPLAGGAVTVPGHISSQFVSGLLLAGPLMERGLAIELSSPLVSVPYVQMTAAVMGWFGVESDGLAVAPGAYTPAEVDVEPDASAAAYFFAAAAISGGRVSVEGLGSSSIQGDVAFVDVLERMGARVERGPRRITVSGSGSLHGVDADLSDISDTAQTLAAVAAFADSPTTVRGVGFIRAKESDRIGALVEELRRAGVEATAEEDGFTVTPAPLRPALLRTYDDHRMAMSLALLGLRAPGIEIENPACVAKTYPGFFADLEKLR